MNPETRLIGEVQMDRAIYDRGVLAAKEGLSPDSNPYRSESSRFLWNLGYMGLMLELQDEGHELGA